MYEWRENFTRSASPMLRERVGDLKDVEIRVLTLLMDLPDHDPVDVTKGTNAILVTHDLTPSLTVQLDRSSIAAIATDAGTRTSHVAILARSLGLPAVVGLRTATQELVGGGNVIVDGSTGAQGVGLMRTEFLVVGRASMPDEDEQYRAYTRVLKAFDGKPVVIRTFDIGGDKLPVGGFPSGPNPFLVWRAIRIGLDQPVLLRVQTCAPARAPAL